MPRRISLPGMSGITSDPSIVGPGTSHAPSTCDGAQQRARARPANVVLSVAGTKARQMARALLNRMPQGAATRSMLTRKTLYALKALSLLAEDDDRGLVATCELAERGGIPRKFLETILRELQQHGILFSQRGPGGGYALRRDPGDIALATVVRALNGPLPSVPCIGQRANLRCIGCSNGYPCSVSRVMKELHDATARVLETTTLLDLVRPPRQATEAAASAAYSI